jgi:hypothetical protein
MCHLGMDRAWQTSSSTPVPKILELEELVEKSKFITGIVAPKMEGGGVGSLKTTKNKVKFVKDIHVTVNLFYFNIFNYVFSIYFIFYFVLYNVAFSF